MSDPGKVPVQQATSVSKTRAAIVQRLALKTTAKGSFSAPCIPALSEHYLEKVLQLFQVIDRPLSGEQRQGFEQTFRELLEEGFRTSPYARFVVEYGPSSANPGEFACSLSAVSVSLEEQYQLWLENVPAAEPFGKHGDAKVLEVAKRLAALGPVRVLDVGAGSGRNTLPLARLGLSVDAVEPVPKLARALRQRVESEKLAVRVLERDVLLDATELGQEQYQLVILSEVTPHFSRGQLDRVLPKLVRSILPGKTLLFNAFVARDDYAPDPVADQVAQNVWSTFFQRAELAELGAREKLDLVSDDPCVAYEQAHLPAAAWPPTPWYVSWASGHNLFEESAGSAPIELRWLEYRRQ
jgi:SAM-dependent methyltransferase